MTQWIVAALVALFALPAAAGPDPTEKPFLWVVEKEGSAPNFLFGTMHVPDDRVLALPDVVEKALDRCDAFYAELDMSPGNMMAQQKVMMIPAGQPGLSKILPEETKESTSAMRRATASDPAGAITSIGSSGWRSCTVRINAWAMTMSPTQRGPATRMAMPSAIPCSRQRRSRRRENRRCSRRP